MHRYDCSIRSFPTFLHTKGIKKRPTAALSVSHPYFDETHLPSVFCHLFIDGDAPSFQQIEVQRGVVPAAASSSETSERETLPGSDETRQSGDNSSECLAMRLTASFEPAFASALAGSSARSTNGSLSHRSPSDPTRWDSSAQHASSE